MKVSVCIPTYNRPDLLKEAVESCLAQSYLPAEIVIGDDSKNEESRKYIEGIKDSTAVKIKYYKHPTSLGQLANVNELINHAEGDKFVLLHDDDLLLPDAIKLMMECFEKHPTINVVYGKQMIINESGIINEAESERLNKYYYRTKEYEGRVMPAIDAGIVQQFPNDCYMVDMDIVKKLKYNLKEKVGNAGDFDFGFRLGVAGYQFYFLNEYTAKYRITESSVARNGTDSAYQSYKLVNALNYPNTGTVNYQKVTLIKKAPIALVQALERGFVNDAIKIYFSKYHQGKILSLGGARRLLLIAKALLGFKLKK